MRTTVNVELDLLEDVKRLTGEARLGRAVNAALVEFVRQQSIAQLRRLAGNIEIEDNWQEMEEIELEHEKW